MTETMGKTRPGPVKGAGVCPIMMACDESYAMPLATALRSMAEANPGHRLEVFLLTSEFSAEGRSRVLASLPQDSVTLHWVPMALDSFQGFTPPAYISKITFARLLLPDLIPPDITRILYLDADILVLGDLTTLNEMDMEGFACAAVIDTDAVPNAERLGLYADEGQRTLCPYFNAGVLLVDVPSWRRDRISEKALQFLMQNPKSQLADQDALNVACAGSWKKLDARWNFQEHFELGYSPTAPAEWPPVVHFAGKWKPWNPKSLHVDSGFYDAYRERTQFARTFTEKLGDARQYGWSALKHSLRQFKFVASLRSRWLGAKS